MGSIALVLFTFVNLGTIAAIQEVYKSKGDVHLALILTNCHNNSDQELIKSAVWTVKKVNDLEIVPQISFGLSVYKTCTEKDELEAIFQLFRKHEEEFFLGLISDSRLSSRVQKFCELLDVECKEIFRCPIDLIKASVSLLSVLGWVENVTVLAPNEVVMEDFFEASRKEWICVKEHVIYESPIPLKNSSDYKVIFGNYEDLATYAQIGDPSDTIFIPLDGSLLDDLPDGNYLITSPHTPLASKFLEFNYIPTPTLFEIATPVLGYVQNLWLFLIENCNETIYKVNCLRNKLKGFPLTTLEPIQIVDLLNVATLIPNFNYYIYKTDGSYSKIFSYNIFYNNMTGTDFPNSDNSTSSKFSCSKGKCQNNCKNFELRGRVSHFSNGEIRIRTESWVFAFLSISLLGVIFCIAILIFLLVAVCRRSTLEGNPVLTMLLLVTVMLMYCSILPLSLEGRSKTTKESVCITRALAITLSFSAAFSLILSRSILLATASKEIGFMSHVAGPVQSFLCLFIFGVQAALSLQIVGRCSDIFKGHTFVYLLSYNCMLLLLQLCLCPLIVRCQRNYKEGKYFTVATAIIVCLWCVWIPSYAFLDEDFKDTILCFGLVSTASVLIGAIFVPRTYLMTIAAAKDKITSTLPSLAGATSAMDIYRTGTQPVYDCVNVAAINAVSLARAGLAVQQPDLYTCPNLPEDEDFRCDSPVGNDNDKVTRF